MVESISRGKPRHITALANLGASEPPSAETMAAIEKLICKLYVPNKTITIVKVLQQWLFKKKQAQSEKRPPTQAALEQTVTRANYQAMVWNNDIVPQPQLPSPHNFGWKWEDNKWLPVMTTLPPFPEAVIQLVKCGCARDVRPAAANVVKQISTALTCVTAAIVEIFVRTAISQMMILKMTRMLRMKVMIAVDRTVVFSLEQRISSDLSDLVIRILRLFMLE